MVKFEPRMLECVNRDQSLPASTRRIILYRAIGALRQSARRMLAILSQLCPSICVSRGQMCGRAMPFMSGAAICVVAMMQELMRSPRTTCNFDR